MLALATPAWAEKKPEFDRPPWAGAYEPQGVDERGKWMELDEYERQFRDLPIVLRDEQLTAYVRSVLCKTVGDDRCRAARIYIVRDRSFNASMAPNGMMQVHTGLLARVHSEAELATVLGHEFAHFELRHTLDAFRKKRAATDAMAWLGLAGAATARDTSFAQSTIFFGLFSYSREQEKAADFLSADFMRASLYPLHASAVWQRLMDEEDALRAERKMRKVKHYTPGPTDTHPTNLQRFAYFLKFEAEPGAQEGNDGKDEYYKETSRVLPELFDGLIKANEFAAADYVINSRGQDLGWDGLLLYTRGELYRQRGNPRDLVTARGFFEQASMKSDAPPETWRGLGYTAMRSGDSAVGRTALEEYLAKVPDARDAAAVKLLLEN